jgi:hypothetical protein
MSNSNYGVQLFSIPADHCFPSAIVLAPESRELVAKGFKQFFDFFNELKANGLSTSIDNIDYKCGVDKSVDLKFKINCMRELTKRGHQVDLDSPIEEMRSILRAELELRYRIQRYKDALHCSHVAIKNDALLGPEDTPCCILHAHQRQIEKIVTILLREGLKECNGAGEITAFLDDVYKVVNKDIFLRKDMHEEDKSG